MTAENWFDSAACKGRDPASFFALMDDEYDDEGNRVAVSGQWHHIREVAGLCGVCPVRLNCMDYVMSLPVNEDGYWAGTFRAQRKRIREMWSNSNFYDEQKDAVFSVALALSDRCEVCL